jgi:hypothetical protein
MKGWTHKSTSNCAKFVTSALNESFAQVNWVRCFTYRKGNWRWAKAIVAGLQAANRGQTAVRQGGARALLADQEARWSLHPLKHPEQVFQKYAMPMSLIEDMPEARFSTEV